MKHNDSTLIDEAGGTGVIAALCRCTPGAVSQWRRHGIPGDRRQFLDLRLPKIFAPDNAPNKKRKNTL